MGIRSASESKPSEFKPFEKGLYRQVFVLDENNKCYIGSRLDKNGNAMITLTSKLMAHENGEECRDLRVYNNFYRLNVKREDGTDGIDFERFAATLAAVNMLDEFVDTFGDEPDLVSRVSDVDIWLKMNFNNKMVLGYVHEVDKFPKETDDNGNTKKVLANKYFKPLESQDVSDIPADMPF